MTDTLDVWFDSGVTHACVLDKREQLMFPADLYLEGLTNIVAVSILIAGFNGHERCSALQSRFDAWFYRRQERRKNVKIQR